MKKPDKFYFVVYLLYFIFIFVVYLILCLKIGDLFKYGMYGFYCCLASIISCHLCYYFIFPFFKKVIHKVKNGNPKAEKGEKGIENGTDDFNRI